MMKNSLIIYASRTGNTEKISRVFKKVFDRNGWQCDVLKVDRDTDVTNIPYDYNEYDFLCFGSPVYHSLALAEVVAAIRRTPIEQSKRVPHEKIIFGTRKGIVFATYSGAHLGPKEAKAALAWMELEMEHQKIKCIGSYSCPGAMITGDKKKDNDTGKWFHSDMINRPNERDLHRAEIFLEDKLEEIAERPN